MNRRQIIILLGAVAVPPVTAIAQQPAKPVIGLLRPAAAHETGPIVSFYQALKDAGYVEGQSLLVERRWADGQYDRLPALAAELVRRRVAVIVTPGSMPAALAAKAATNTTPIVFSSGTDPVASGLIASFNRPGGNITGINYLSSDLAPKRLGLLHELVPKAARFGVLLNPNNVNAKEAISEVEAAANQIGQKIEILHASNATEIDAAFTKLVELKCEALLGVNDSILTGLRVQIAALAARYAIPAIYTSREYADVGGLMSYGTSLADAYRQVGVYTVRILKGERPADLPVARSVAFEFVINLKTAKTLGLAIPPMLLARADEVIE